MEPRLNYQCVDGDLLQQPVEVIVNAWNRNIIPWWLLLPQGVSGAIKGQAGLAPFHQLARCGPIPLGQARLTSAGRLNYRAIIHVAGINLLWFATRRSVHDSVHNALQLAQEHGFQSIAFPLIGAGSGQRGEAWAMQEMRMALDNSQSELAVRLVRYRRCI